MAFQPLEINYLHAISYIPTHVELQPFNPIKLRILRNVQKRKDIIAIMANVNIRASEIEM